MTVFFYWISAKLWPKIAIGCAAFSSEHRIELVKNVIGPLPARGRTGIFLFHLQFSLVYITSCDFPTFIKFQINTDASPNVPGFRRIIHKFPKNLANKYSSKHVLPGQFNEQLELLVNDLSQYYFYFNKLKVAILNNISYEEKASCFSKVLKVFLIAKQLQRYRWLPTQRKWSKKDGTSEMITEMPNRIEELLHL